LYETNQLGHSTPDTIINSLWCNLTTHLGMRVNTEHLNLRWGDITLKSDMFGHEYLELAEEQQTKTRTGAYTYSYRTVIVNCSFVHWLCLGIQNKTEGPKKYVT
jgi:hypothetical protein